MVFQSLKGLTLCVEPRACLVEVACLGFDELEGASLSGLKCLTAGVEPRTCLVEVACLGFDELDSLFSWIIRTLSMSDVFGAQLTSFKTSKAKQKNRMALRQFILDSRLFRCLYIFLSLRYSPLKLRFFYFWICSLSWASFIVVKIVP